MPFAPAVGHLVRGTRHAFRAFRKYPAFTAIAVAAIGLGMGFNTTRFTVMFGTMCRPLPVADPGSLRNVEPRGLGQQSSYNSQSFQSFPEFTRSGKGRGPPRWRASRGSRPPGKARARSTDRGGTPKWLRRLSSTRPAKSATVGRLLLSTL
jgi:hypothetical protein